MTVGRKPTPTHLRVVRGNPSKRPLPKDEPTPEPMVVTEIPEWLSPTAKAHWPTIAKQLHEAGILTKIDSAALGLYCEAFARWIEANAQVVQFGAVIKSPNDFPVQSPYLSIANKAFEQMKSMLVEFGMTPSSRTRVAVVPGRTKAKRAGSFDEFKTAR